MIILLRSRPFFSVSTCATSIRLGIVELFLFNMTASLALVPATIRNANNALSLSCRVRFLSEYSKANLSISLASSV